MLLSSFSQGPRLSALDRGQRKHGELYKSLQVIARPLIFRWMLLETCIMLPSNGSTNHQMPILDFDLQFALIKTWKEGIWPLPQMNFYLLKLIVVLQVEAWKLGLHQSPLFKSFLVELRRGWGWCLCGFPSFKKVCSPNCLKDSLACCKAANPIWKQWIIKQCSTSAITRFNHKLLIHLKNIRISFFPPPRTNKNQ